MNRARINHYENKYDLNEPIETLTGKANDDYIEFKTKSFSPFIVDSYYKEIPYLPVKTGIE